MLQNSQGDALDSRLKLTDVLQQRLRRVIPLSLHAPPECREQTRCTVRETETFLLIGFDILTRCVSAYDVGTRETEKELDYM